MKIDLHVHSRYSDDGQYAPSELVEMAKQQGLDALAITDHNWVKAVPEGLEKAKELGIKLIPATEIDCEYQDIGFHILAYNIDYTNPCFNGFGAELERQEQELSQLRLKLTNDLGFKITREEMDKLSKNGVYTGEMFGEILLNKEEYKDDPRLMPYRKGGSRSINPMLNFYWDFYSQGKSCFVKANNPSAKEVVDLIHENGGRAILAHPGQNLKGNYELFDKMVKELGLDGVEAYSSYHDEDTIKYFIDKAKEHNILVTCGSDYHGKYKPAISLGGHGCDDKEYQSRLVKMLENSKGDNMSENKKELENQQVEKVTGGQIVATHPEIDKKGKNVNAIYGSIDGQSDKIYIPTDPIDSNK